MNKDSIYKLFFIVLILLAAACTKNEKESNHPTATIEPYLDITLTDAERDSLLSLLEDNQKSFQELHKFHLDNSVGMALEFNPLPQGFEINKDQKPIRWNLPATVELPTNREELAFFPVYKLATLIKNKKITSVELTQLYLARIKKYKDTLECVISITEAQALEQAKTADEEIAKGIYRGPLHGIPYGIKDLLAVAGTKTTWGAGPYKDQTIDITATVVSKLEAAGAVLVAKLTLGSLAMGDIWYGGKTRNPWNLDQGSSGSSAGSASATAAGLVAFAIGTETYGSIVSPSNRCGATGLRPTYGVVSRHGAMALSWSMDKIGPICRSALDCALVFDVIRGEDGRDSSVKNFAFNYAANADLRKLRVGYLKTLFEKDTSNKEQHARSLALLQSQGIELVPVELPSDLPVKAISFIIDSEGGAAFDEMTRSNRDSLLTDQSKGAWPNAFRSARFIPAVEYINAQRIRKVLIEEYHQKTKDFDVIIAPSFEGDQLLMTNLTGHPCLVVPNGFNKKGSPTSISFLGKLYGEAALISIGRAIQEATEWEDMAPPLFK